MTARTLGIGAVAVMTGLSIVAAFVGFHPRAGSGGGTLLLAISSRGGDELGEGRIEIRSEHGGWAALGHFSGGRVPAAPATLAAARAEVAPGLYRAIRVGGRSLPVTIRVTAHQVEPVLITVNAGSPEAAYAGNEDYNTAMLALEGKLPRLPPFSLVDQTGRAVSESSLAGSVVVVAAFHTTCRDTCPLYTAVLSQLRGQLAANVRLVEISTDPERDTPAALRNYALLADTSWPLLTGSREELGAFWSRFGVQLSGEDSHSSFLGVFDEHGFLRQTRTGVPDAGQLPGGLAGTLSVEGARELAGHGDGWGANQVADAIRNLNIAGAASQSGGSRAPDFEAPALAGGSLSPSQFRHGPLLINFWASSCAPCRREMPLIQAEAERAGVPVLLVAERDSPAAARAFLGGVGVQLPSALDADGRVAALYGVNVLPVTVFVRGDGTIEGRYVGETSREVLRDHLAALRRG